jgi:hypothetical protein
VGGTNNVASGVSNGSGGGSADVDVGVEIGVAAGGSSASGVGELLRELTAVSDRNETAGGWVGGELGGTQ